MKSLLEQAMEKSNIGTIFSIKKFAIHDGQGIRTTVFLKGCNLRCKWCHNPEGLELEPKYHILSRCIHCDKCKSVDDEHRITSKNNQYYIEGNHDIQKYQEQCIMDAIQLDCQLLTTEQLLTIIQADQVFYKHGGGVTFSGGEPLLQYEYLLQMLQILKEKNIHCALETALHYEYSKIEKLLPYLDEIYIDLKIEDEKLHLLHTGVSNKTIKENIKKLLQSDYRSIITVRTPLIPQYSATTQNIHAIASFLQSCYPNTKYELLNYNPLAIGKYQELDLPFCFEENKPMYSTPEMNAWKDIARQYNLLVK